MYDCEYCGEVFDCHHRREKIAVENAKKRGLINDEKPGQFYNFITKKWQDIPES